MPDGSARMHIAVGTLLLCLALALACASGSGTVTRSERGIFARPPQVLVYNFAVDPDDVVVDTFGPDFSRRSSESRKKNELGRQAANLLAEQVVAKLRAKGIPAQRANDTTVPPLHAFLVKGQFVKIDEGDRAKRLVVGFGAGASEIKARVQVYQLAESGLRPVEQGIGSAKGSRTPGMAVPIAGGAAAGRVATAAVVSASTKLATEMRGGLETDTGHLADQIVERAEQFYRRQGWL